MWIAEAGFLEGQARLAGGVCARKRTAARSPAPDAPGCEPKVNAPKVSTNGSVSWMNIKHKHPDAIRVCIHASSVHLSDNVEVLLAAQYYPVIFKEESL